MAAKDREKNVSSQPRSFRQFKRNKQAYALAIPFAAVFTAVTLIPLVLTLLFSFMNIDLTGLPKWAGISNFKLVFSDSGAFADAFGNSLTIGFSSLGLGLLLSFPAAWLIEFAPKKLRGALTALLAFSGIMSSLCSTLVFDGNLRSVLNSFLLSSERIDVPTEWLSDKTCAIWAVIISQLGVMFSVGLLVFRAGFSRIPPERYYAAAADGAENRFQKLWYVALPSMRAEFMFAAAFQTGIAFTFSDVLRQLLGVSPKDFAAYNVMTYIHEHGLSHFEIGQACAANIILIALMTAVYAAFRLLSEKVRKE